MVICFEQKYKFMPIRNNFIFNTFFVGCVFIFHKFVQQKFSL